MATWYDACLNFATSTKLFTIIYLHIYLVRIILICLAAVSIFTDTEVKMLNCYVKALSSGALARPKSSATSLLYRIAIHHLAHAIFAKAKGASEASPSWNGVNWMKILLTSAGVADAVIENLCFYGSHVPLSPSVGYPEQLVDFSRGSAPAAGQCHHVLLVVSEAVQSSVAEKNASNSRMLMNRGNVLQDIGISINEVCNL
jgi:hypothetical protein